MIYSVACFIVKVLQKGNLVEYFKTLILCLRGAKENDERGKILAVDLYILAKFLAITLFWILGGKGWVFGAITYYLLFTNVATYFY
jgi:hypothetical protein